MGLPLSLRAISCKRVKEWKSYGDVTIVKELSLEESLVKGSNGQCTIDMSDSHKPMVVRGVTSKSEIVNCKNSGRDFYYIDTGYLGNFPSTGNTSGKKIWHRIVKNDLQHIRPLKLPSDRWEKLLKQDSRLQWKGWKNYNKKILLVLPNPKACRYYDIDCETWIAETTDKIRTYSNLPIEVRVKGSRSERNHGYSIYEAFDSGVYATVSFNSIASLESVLYGIPAFVSVPCAANTLTSNDLSTLKNPYRPPLENIIKMCNTVAYGQYTHEEILNGTAWKIINEIAA